MKKNWLGYLALIFLAIIMAACEGAGTVTKPDIDKQIAELDKNLPPPRAPLADTPDLKNARFEVTDRSLELMRGDGVPTDVIASLEALKGNTYSNASEFIEALEGAIGASALASNQSAIMRNSTHVNLLVEPPFPGAEMRLVVAQPEGAIGTVFFDFDKSNIKSEFLEEIKTNAQKLVDDPSLNVIIEGHADERGTTEYNLALGERRANSVKEAMIANGVNADQLDTVSYGEERPAASGSNEEAWAQNRRAVLVLK